MVTPFGFSQPQTLAEYNRSLFSQLAQRKTLSDKEFKILRIRSNTEMTSATEAFYKEGELLKLIEYATFSAYLSKKKEEEALVKDLWKKFSKLPNPNETYFNVDYIQDLYKVKDDNILNFTNVLDYFLKLIPPPSSLKEIPFSNPLHFKKCGILEDLRKTPELEICWKNFASALKNKNKKVIRPKSYAKLKEAQIKYYSSSYQFRDKFNQLAKKILENKDSPKNLLLLTHNLMANHKIMTGNIKNVDSDLDFIKSSSNLVEIFYARLYLSKNELDKAISYLKKIPETGLNDYDLIVYSRTSAEYFFKINDYKKTKHYLNKALTLQKDTPLQTIPIYLELVAIEFLTQNDQALKEASQQFEEYSKKMAELKVDDPARIAQVRLGKLLVNKAGSDLSEVKKAVDDVKRFYTPLHYIHQVLDKVLTQVKESQIK